MEAWVGWMEEIEGAADGTGERADEGAVAEVDGMTKGVADSLAEGEGSSSHDIHYRSKDSVSYLFEPTHLRFIVQHLTS